MAFDDYSKVLARPTSYIKNLAYSVFSWGGIPPEIIPSSETLEKLLIRFGMLALFLDERSQKLYLLPFTNIQFNLWGEPIEKNIMPQYVNASGSVQMITKDETFKPIILFDQPSHKSIMSSIDWYTEQIGYLDTLIRLYTNMLAYPNVFFAEKRNRRAVEALSRKLLNGLPGHVFLQDSINLEEAIGNLSLNVSPQTLVTLNTIREELIGLAFEEVGVPDGNQFKLAQRSQTEVLMPTLPTTLKSKARYNQREIFRQKLIPLIKEYHKIDAEVTLVCNSLSLVEASLIASTGKSISLVDFNQNGVDDRLEQGGTENAV